MGQRKGNQEERSQEELVSRGLPARAHEKAHLKLVSRVSRGSGVKINGVTVGTATSQFIRYSFDLDPKEHRLRSNNSLEVEFDQSIEVGGRFMAPRLQPFGHVFVLAGGGVLLKTT